MSEEQGKEQQEMQQQANQDQDRAQAEPNGGAATEPNGEADEGAEYWKGRSRSWERQAKELKAELGELADAKQLAVDEAKRADDAEAALAAASRELSVLKAASQAGVDAGLLARMAGDTPEEIAENARVLAEGIRAAQPYPAVEDRGNQKAAPLTLADIDAIEDTAQRRRAYADYYSKQIR